MKDYIIPVIGRTHSMALNAFLRRDSRSLSQDFFSNYKLTTKPNEIARMADVSEVTFPKALVASRDAWSAFKDDVGGPGVIYALYGTEGTEIGRMWARSLEAAIDGDVNDAIKMSARMLGRVSERLAERFHTQGPPKMTARDLRATYTTAFCSATQMDDFFTGLDLFRIYSPLFFEHATSLAKQWASETGGSENTAEKIEEVWTEINRLTYQLRTYRASQAQFLFDASVDDLLAVIDESEKRKDPITDQNS